MAEVLAPLPSLSPLSSSETAADSKSTTPADAGGEQQAAAAAEVAAVEENEPELPTSSATPSSPLPPVPEAAAVAEPAAAAAAPELKPSPAAAAAEPAHPAATSTAVVVAEQNKAEEPKAAAGKKDESLADGNWTNVRRGSHPSFLAAGRRGTTLSGCASSFGVSSNCLLIPCIRFFCRASDASLPLILLCCCSFSHCSPSAASAAVSQTLCPVGDGHEWDVEQARGIHYILPLLLPTSAAATAARHPSSQPRQQSA